VGFFFAVLAVIGLVLTSVALLPWPRGNIFAARLAGVPVMWARPMIFWAVSGFILLFITFARLPVADMVEGIAVALLWIVIGLMSMVRVLADRDERRPQ
jgi:hypothetical protein